LTDGKTFRRAYAAYSSEELLALSASDILGDLVTHSEFDVTQNQRDAWKYQAEHTKTVALKVPRAHFYFEFSIPRMGRRADVIIISEGLLFVIEYKVGEVDFEKASKEQVLGYALDLKQFHSSSHDCLIVPVLIATRAVAQENVQIEWGNDRLAKTLCLHPEILASTLQQATAQFGVAGFAPEEWVNGIYKPTPTIIEAAQALYAGHSIKEISRSEATVEHLEETGDYINKVIQEAKTLGRKVICFVTGVPGSGKTLAGLNIAAVSRGATNVERAVYLSGNGPLVDVLREALARDAISGAKFGRKFRTKAEAFRAAQSFIQNVHHFRRDSIESKQPPDEHIVIFDEAQRAWNAEHLSKFMSKKYGKFDITTSESELLLEVFDRHPSWCAVICLVGTGQEINTGEAGIEEWLRSVRHRFSTWTVHMSPSMRSDQGAITDHLTEKLHLGTSIRSFRAETFSDFTEALINGNASEAAAIASKLNDYPIVVTRDLSRARQWLRAKRRGSERSGLVVSSGGIRLKPLGIYSKARVSPVNWFLAPSEDVRSSSALEDAATEFDVQGLELDWACLCWDADLRWNNGWRFSSFVGTNWKSIRDVRQQVFLLNSYRVLLTRARQGLVIFVPCGDLEDRTREPDLYNPTFNYLKDCGFTELLS
jgi:hypothetical protein